MKNKIRTKLLRIANKAYKEKLEKGKSEMELIFSKDKTVLKQILEIVEKRIVYKNVGENYRPKYIVITEEILLQDYTTEREHQWSRETSIGEDKGELIIKVNGISYYHLSGLLKKQKEDIEKCIENNSWERGKLYEKREALKHLEEAEPAIKKIILEYQEKVKTLE